MNNNPQFDIIYLQGVVDFINSLPEKARVKIYYTINRSMYVMDKDKFKKFENHEIWEFRAKVEGISYRIMAFWDKTSKRLVVATHGFIKKTQKTPQGEIKKAEQIMKEYYNNK